MSGTGRDPAAGARSSLVMRRLTLGVTQEELGERMGGITRGAVAQLELALKPNTRIQTLERWAAALGGRIVITVEYGEEES